MLLDLTLKVSLVVSLAIGATWLMRRQSAAVRHVILAAAIACGAASPLLGLVVPSWSVEFAGLTNQLPEQPAVSSSAAIGDRATPVSPAAGAEASVSIEAQGPARARTATVSDLVLPIWLAGISAGVFTLLVGLARLRWLESRSMTLQRGTWVEIAGDIARGYGLARPPRLLQSGHPSLLATWGWRRSKVILPADAPSWPDDRIRVVLGHELAHVRRRDWLVQIAAEVVRSVYWFNPMLWIGCRRLRQESEQACDDAVLQMGVEGTTYAQHLLDLARAARPLRRTWLPAAAIARPSSLERRISAMLNDHANRQPITRSASLTTFVALLAITAVISGFTASAQNFSSVSGLVVDPQGAVLPGVTLTLTNLQTQAKYEVRTLQTGQFEFVGLPDGDFRLTARQPGFQTLDERITVVGRDLRRDLSLHVGTLEETVTVTGGPPRGERSAVPRVTPVGRTLFERALEQCSASPTPAVGGRIRPPIKIKDVRPRYPEGLQAARIGGAVKLDALIGTDGRVKDVQPVANQSVDPGLVAAAIEAVNQWEFDGTLLNCRPIEVQMAVSVSFDPQQ